MREGLIPLLQAYSNTIFHICGASHGPTAYAELLVNVDNLHLHPQSAHRIPLC